MKALYKESEDSEEDDQEDDDAYEIVFGYYTYK